MDYSPQPICTKASSIYRYIELRLRLNIELGQGLFLVKYVSDSSKRYLDYLPPFSTSAMLITVESDIPVALIADTHAGAPALCTAVDYVTTYLLYLCVA